MLKKSQKPSFCEENRKLSSSIDLLVPTELEPYWTIKPMEKRVFLRRLLEVKALHYRYTSFNVASLGGWENLSELLHQTYCTKDSVVYLGWVCPNCKTQDYTLEHGLHENPGLCFTCNEELESFWSPDRTKHYFSTLPSSYGVLVFNDKQCIGFVWGYEKVFAGKQNAGFYIDFVVIDKSLRHKKKGLGVIFNALNKTSAYAISRGYPYIGGRTQQQRSPLINVFKLYELEYACQDPVDPSRELWFRNI